MSAGDGWRRALEGGRVHLVGAGGAGMSGLGMLMQARGAVVTGCDRARSIGVEDLERVGIEVAVGHDPAHARDADAIVYTSALPSDHAELTAARERGLPVLKRAEAMARVVNAGRVIAIAGTHGKTTTTALAALVLEACGQPVTALVGGRVPEWGGNVWIGGDRVYVVEADEYDRSFLHLRPEIAVVTSVEPEHLDIYGTPEEMERAFDAFLEHVPAEGRVLCCVDDEGARRRLGRAGSRGLGYGIGDAARLRVRGIEPGPDRTRFELTFDGESIGTFDLALYGRHNVLNATAALGIAHLLGLDVGRAAGVLRGFRGVERRFQRLGEAAGVLVVDDYAHHPTEVEATLRAAREAFTDRRVVAAFQPHLYSRTRALAPEFGPALAAADIVFVTDIYAAREAPIPGVTADLVADAAREAAGAERVRRVADLDELAASALAELRPGDVFLTLGAGDIGEAASRVLAGLGAAKSDGDG